MSKYALDLFCGMGGASLGLEQAGLDVSGICVSVTNRRTR